MFQAARLSSFAGRRVVICLVIFAAFFKIGIYSIGGGLATLPFLFELAEQYSWLSPEKIGDFLAIAQSSPGATGVNMAAQTGYLWAGPAGSVAAAMGLITPSIIVIIIVARMLAAFKKNKIVAAVFTGLRPAAAGLLAAAGFGVWKLALYVRDAAAWYDSIRWRELFIFAAFFILVWKFKKHPILYVAAAGALGIALGL
ncbi:MAG: chromate transporter [Treponema sp.]|jgi:chromate transporter|nr:chromate transporter [Treponema sp.]